MSLPPFRILDPSAPDPAFRHRCALTVMAKAPVPGTVKTRLSPPLTPEEAALLNTCFLRDTLASLGIAATRCAADCVISYTPVGQEEAFRGVAPEGTLLVSQRGNGFGERLLFTAADLFRCGFSAVCLIDSDSPTVPTEEWVRAAQILLPGMDEAAHRAALGRSDDGGYYLLGLTEPHAALFENISWSTERVADQTEAAAAAIELPLTRLRTWFDVDDRHSLARLRRELAGDPDVPRGYDAPHTQAFLRLLAVPDADLLTAGARGTHG